MRFQLLLMSLSRNTWWKFYLESNSTNQFFFPARFRHTGAYSGTLRPVKVTSVRKTQHRIRSSNEMEGTPFNRGGYGDTSDTIPSEDELDDLANRISNYSTKSGARDAEQDHMRKVFRELKFIRARVIEKKFFRKPLPPNLLTWSAKEQIQYLHQQDSKEWSAQMLSELFPVSENVIKEIMKSRQCKEHVQEILQHDLTVQKNWADLKESLKSQDVTTNDDVYKAFTNSENEIIIENAGGVKDLPFPVKKVDKFNARRSFSSIVIDCYHAKEQATEKAREELKCTLERLSAELSEVSKIFQVKSQKKTARSSHLKSANMENAQVRASQSRETEQSMVDVNKGNQQENRDRFISRKYKDNPFTSHPEEPRSMKDVRYKIKVPQQMHCKTYISGDCVYDKNGEFLYKIL